MQFNLRLNINSAGRCGRAGRKGLVTAIIAKRDKILSDAIQVQQCVSVYCSALLLIHLNM